MDRYRLGNAEYLRMVRAARKAAGLCRYCTQPAQGGTSMCWRHRVYQAARKAIKRAEAA